MIDDATGGQDEPKRAVASRRRGLGKGLGAILPSVARAEERPSRSDELTDLPNRAVLDERFEQAMARCVEDGAPLAVLVVALDDFGAVNVSFGHHVGDELLQDAAARLSAARRKSDTVARFAGDEFVVVCPYIATAELACEMAARILEDLARPSSVEGVEHELSASIGVVFTSPRDAPDGAQSFETLLGDASLAMRRAKEAGGASWRLFDPSMRRHVAVRSQNRQDLRAAMEEGRLVLEYEPIVHLETGVAVGDSALLGWRQPAPEVDDSRTLLDLVEEAGLAVPIGTWMLDQALMDLSTRNDRAKLPANFRVWVKLAPSLLADPALVVVVDELTAKHRVSPSVLGLDIREPTPATLGSTEATLRELDDRDVAVALDDFGAGPSNLALLQRLPIAGLKLAPALVSALGATAVAPVPAPDAAAVAPGPAADAARDADAAPATDRDSDVLAPDSDRDADVLAPDSDRDAGRDDDLGTGAAALVHGLIELGRALELTVVAQGVESEAQVATLRDLGCGYAQGPILGHDAVPVPRGTTHPEESAEPESLWATGTMSTEP
ncbi:MAG: EAL domain-containing protein [Acidimicrobiales bacterium]|nr:EAL domain-containing protein [Acidimicrobiales bacterium]